MKKAFKSAEEKVSRPIITKSLPVLLILSQFFISSIKGSNNEELPPKLFRKSIISFSTACSSMNWMSFLQKVNISVGNMSLQALYLKYTILETSMYSNQ